VVLLGAGLAFWGFIIVGSDTGKSRLSSRLRKMLNPGSLWRMEEKILSFQVHHPWNVYVTNSTIKK
jgi:hypothetical protein